MAVGIVKNICFNLDKRQPTKTMKLILKKIYRNLSEAANNIAEGTE